MKINNNISRFITCCNTNEELLEELKIRMEQQ